MNDGRFIDLKKSIIISIDPGDKNIGVVAYNRQLTIDFKFFKNNQNSIIGLIQYIEHIAEWNNPVDIILVIEDFVNYTHKMGIKGFKQNRTSEMIGMLDLVAERHGWKVYKQLASHAKIFDNHRLEHLDLLYGVPLKNKHTLDAYRHLVYWLNKHCFENRISRSKIFTKDTLIIGV